MVPRQRIWVPKYAHLCVQCCKPLISHAIIVYDACAGLSPKCPDVIARVRARRQNPLAPEIKAPEWRYLNATERFSLGFMTMNRAWGPYHAILYWVQMSNKVV